MKNKAIYLKNELCQALFEFAPNQMILYAHLVHMFIIRNFKVTRKIDDPNMSNSYKFSFNVFPGFDEETFPFVVASG